MLSKINAYVAARWREDGGYRQVLALSVPLILSTGSWSILHFVDRMFLTWYSPEAIAAALPAGFLNWTVMSLFMGTASYTSTFVAQYSGADQKHRVGPSVWQGIYVAIFGGLVMLLMIPLARPIFHLVGHDPLVQKEEIVFFQLICIGAIFAVAAAAMSGFFSGLGKPWTLVWVNALATLINIVLDYLLVFGNFGFPRWGIAGAAIATDLASFSTFLVYLVLFAKEKYNRQYRLLSGWRFDWPLFKRLIAFGLPSGVQFFLDIAGFTAFIVFVGRLGTLKLAATNIAFNINTLAFMPMLGVGIAVSVLVGQNQGKTRPDLAEKSTYSGVHLTFLYMTAIALLFVLVPGVFVDPFLRNADPSQRDLLRTLTVNLLCFVAVYSIFDSMNIIFSSALRGAGDTRFVMVMIFVISALVLALPTYIGLGVLHRGIYTAWSIASAYIILLAFAFLFRFLGGKWKSMRVIEEMPPHIPSSLPESPTIEMD